MKTTLMAGAALAALAYAAPAAAQLVFEPGAEDRFNWTSFEEFAAAHDLSGQTIDVSGPWIGGDARLFESVIAYFEEATGASVNYTGSDSFEQDIVISAQAGSAPHVAVFPQPGLAADMAARGFLSPLGDETTEWLRENYAAGDSWVDLGTYAGPDGAEALYGFFYKIDVKSLVWYAPEQFEEAGYEVPQSMEDLKALTEQIVEDGGTPWCVGLGSGAATGWPATDWVEDLMLRLHEPSVYDQWVSNELPFDDERVVEAIEEFGWFVRNDSFVQGGTQAVATTGELHSDLLSRRLGIRDGLRLLLLSVLLGTRSRQPGARRWHRLRAHPRQRGGARLHRVPEDADRARGLDGADRLPHPLHRGQHRGVWGRFAARHGRDPAGGHDLPI
jgi:alpha-glucoside transport system substrate-binding protein